MASAERVERGHLAGWPLLQSLVWDIRYVLARHWAHPIGPTTVQEWDALLLALRKVSGEVVRACSSVWKVGGVYAVC